ncbi:SDR family NAD(P)-dependent oxidoreductase [Novosphingobium sp. KCTC 2891]|uniref:SDR family NAD(P)-dependent oxidoreductase n=1 Tax=Novosphingobium sp. KCTC 2891 TaxID=2989730 RepID=UPI002223B415|nr:SDR family NAD(P)-dependent oxidoreductase [Novosphingobium sp. KCTC 2891]MCW1383847.1 SDR family NAD(P)-dependent oxidoreductase [Novosphingobium sp. KCTC 2891]
MPGLRCAVFGASGGIGAALVDALALREDVAVVHAGARRQGAGGGKVRPFAFDLTDEASIAAACTGIGAPLDLAIVATGRLTLSDGSGPEKSYRALDAARLAESFAVNAIGPALVAKHVLPLLPKDRRSVFAALSARVGSISDNRLGGWHGYRASKAALNMLVRNFAVELGRTHRDAVVVALHPGTVDTGLSAPFQKGVAEGKLFTAEFAADRLLAVLDGLGPADSGKLFAWDGAEVAF